MTPMQQLGEVLNRRCRRAGLPMKVASSRRSKARRKSASCSARSRRPRDDPRRLGGRLPRCSTRTTRSSSIAAACRRCYASRGLESPRLILTSLASTPANTRAGRRHRRHRTRRQRDHSLNARLTKGPKDLTVSDLMLVSQPPVAGELPRPRPTTVIDSETVRRCSDESPDQAMLGSQGDAADLRRRERQRAGERRARRRRAATCARSPRKCASAYCRRANMSRADHRAAGPARDAN